MSNVVADNDMWHLYKCSVTEVDDVADTVVAANTVVTLDVVDFLFKLVIL